MHDLERYEHLSGAFGMPGSRYRMVPKAGSQQMEFVSTVTASNLPDRLVLKLELPAVDVSVTATFTAAVRPAGPECSRNEVFTFHGPFNKLFSRLASRDIRKHHRDHIESFKRFVECT